MMAQTCQNMTFKKGRLWFLVSKTTWFNPSLNVQLKQPHSKNSNIFSGSITLATHTVVQRVQFIIDACLETLRVISSVCMNFQKGWNYHKRHKADKVHFIIPIPAFSCLLSLHPTGFFEFHLFLFVNLKNTLKISPKSEMQTVIS